MDALSQRLSLYPVRTALDSRCNGALAWDMQHAAQPCGTAPYHLVVQGGAVLRMAGHPPLQLAAGDMLVLARGSAHTLHVGEGLEPGTATDILCGQFHFGSGVAGALAASLPERLLVRTGQDQRFLGLQALMHMLRDEAGNVEPGAGAVVSHVASALLALILRAWGKQEDTVPGLFALLAERRLAPALQAMLASPELAWSLDRLAQLCNMSRSTFMRAFRKVAGVTPGELLARLRMAQAAQWLKKGQRSVGEVGAAVGYESEAAFHRAFKRHMGKGPGQYRAEVSRPGTHAM